MDGRRGENIWEELRGENIIKMYDIKIKAIFNRRKIDKNNTKQLGIVRVVDMGSKGNRKAEY